MLWVRECHWGKWVDDFIFFRLPISHIAEHNKVQNHLQNLIGATGGELQTGGRIRYKGNLKEENGFKQFAEDLTFPLRVHGYHLAEGTTYPYDLDDINEVTKPLSIP